jgi:hypothetical protein
MVTTLAMVALTEEGQEGIASRMIGGTMTTTTVGIAGAVVGWIAMIVGIANAIVGWIAMIVGIANAIVGWIATIVGIANVIAGISAMTAIGLAGISGAKSNQWTLGL